MDEKCLMCGESDAEPALTRSLWGPLFCTQCRERIEARALEGNTKRRDCGEVERLTAEVARLTEALETMRHKRKRAVAWGNSEHARVGQLHEQVSRLTRERDEAREALAEIAVLSRLPDNLPNAMLGPATAREIHALATTDPTERENTEGRDDG